MRDLELRGDVIRALNGAFLGRIRVRRSPVDPLDPALNTRLAPHRLALQPRVKAQSVHRLDAFALGPVLVEAVSLEGEGALVLLMRRFDLSEDLLFLLGQRGHVLVEHPFLHCELAH